jgi:hypothetical protein
MKISNVASETTEMNKIRIDLKAVRCGEVTRIAFPVG